MEYPRYDRSMHGDTSSKRVDGGRYYCMLHAWHGLIESNPKSLHLWHVRTFTYPSTIC
jgi:hypothetical protein